MASKEEDKLPPPESNACTIQIEPTGVVGVKMRQPLEVGTQDPFRRG
jgi:hypothetical protein